MYPVMFTIFGRDVASYSVMLVLGVLSAVGLFRILSGFIKTPDKIYNYYSTVAVVSIAVGLVSAFLFQAVYNFFDTGVFKIQGLTFMGGLIGGAACFILFAVFARNKGVKRAFFVEAELAAPCIAIAHCLGRIGCFLAGCCYGKPSEHGLDFPYVGKVLPTQLYEAAFLLVLFGALLFLTLYRRAPKGFNLIIYCIAYAVFRFIIEFFRDDYRGAFIGALSPSQFQSIVLLLCGIGLLVFRLKKPSMYDTNIIYSDPLVLPEKKETQEESTEDTQEESAEKTQDNDTNSVEENNNENE